MQNMYMMIKKQVPGQPANQNDLVSSISTSFVLGEAAWTLTENK